MAGKWTRHGHWVPSGGEIMSTDDLASRPPIAGCGWNGGGTGGVPSCLSCALDATHTIAEATLYLDTRDPKVNDRVLYRSFGTPNGEYAPQDRAAVVTEVDAVNPLWVGLVVFNPTGQFFRSLADGGSHFRPHSGGGSWHWGAQE